MQQLLPALLGWLSDAPDPDLGLLALRRLTEGYNRSSTLARRFRESPIAAERTCRILGSSRVLGAALYRQPDFVDALADDASLTAEAARDELVDEALDSLDWREDDAGRGDRVCAASSAAISSASARATCSASRRSTPRDASSRSLADACVEAALRSLEPALPFAVIGLGRLGGAELSYASDIDVIFVYDGDDRRRLRRRRAHRDAARAARSATARRKDARSASTRACARRATKARSRGRSAATARTSRNGRRRGSSRRSRRRASSPATPSSANASSRSRTSSCTATRSPRSGGARSAA